MRPWLRPLVLAVGLAVLGTPAIPSAQTSPALAAGLARATTTLYELVHLPADGIPREVLARAHAVAVFPGVVKGAFLLGGQAGSGVVSARRADGSWSGPAVFTFAGGSIGLQVGAEITDVVLVITNAAGLDTLVRGEVTLGADLSAAAGPVGRRLDGQTDWRFQADVLSYSRSRGLFAGMSVGGARLAADDDENRELYGQLYTARQILQGTPHLPVPEVARGFVQTLQAASQPR
jgi:lipid-binding SYLF domain-containing protein